jgi:hypothetical protein
LRHPDDADLVRAEKPPSNDHPFADLFRDRDVRLLFDGALLGAELSREVFGRYAGTAPQQSSSVGA